MKSYQLTDHCDLELETSRLKQQAQILYMFEAEVFKAAFCGFNRHLIDFGCGEGSFTSIIRNQFSQVTAIDINNELLNIAKDQHLDIDFKSIRGLSPIEIVSWLHSISPTAVLLRFVVQHLNPSEWGLLKILAEYCVRHSVRLVIIDIDDSELTIIPENSTLTNYYCSLTNYTAQRGGCRLLNKKIHASFLEWNVPILRRDRIEVIFNEKNAADFEVIMMPALIRSNPQSNPQMVKDSFSKYFENSSRLHMPLFYHIV